jgi:hypothetical protein
MCDYVIHNFYRQAMMAWAHWNCSWFNTVSIPFTVPDLEDPNVPMSSCASSSGVCILWVQG